MARSNRKKNRRKLVVFISLLSAFGLTSALLLALAPAPLTPDAVASLLAVDSPQSINVIYQTHEPIGNGRWKYIYVRHTGTAGGNALTLGAPATGLGDHFLIGNGNGCMDGEIQVGQRWNRQESASAPLGVSRIDENCVSISLVGDFDQVAPTTVQMRRLSQLVASLQSRLRIPANRVILIDQPGSPAGVGQQFPSIQFRNQLLMGNAQGSRGIE